MVALQRGSMGQLPAEDEQYVLGRVGEGASALAAFNNAAGAATLHVPLTGARIDTGTLLEDGRGAATPVRVSGNRVEIRLLPHSSAIHSAREKP
jgi:hypothetical protein